MSSLIGVLSDKRGNVLPNAVVIAREAANPAGDLGQDTTDSNGTYDITVVLSGTKYNLFISSEAGGASGPNFAGKSVSSGSVVASFVLLDDADWKIEHYGNGGLEAVGTHKSITTDDITIRDGYWIETEDDFLELRIGSSTARLRIDNTPANNVFWFNSRPIVGNDNNHVGLIEAFDASDRQFYFGTAKSYYIKTDGKAIMGSMGIGIDPPTSLLEVADNNAHPIITITALHNTDYDPMLQFRSDATPAVTFSMGTDSGDGNKLKFDNDANIGDSAFFVLDGTNVGVGNSLPGGNYTARLNVTAVNDVTPALILAYDNASRVNFTVESDGDMVIEPHANGTNKNIGIHTTPSACLDVLKTTEQLRLRYDANNFLSVTVESDGDVRLDPTGVGSTDRWIGIHCSPAANLHVTDIHEQLRLAYDVDSYCSFTVASDSDLTIKPAETGQVKIQATTDSTGFFQILDADGGVPVLNVDSTNERVSVGVAAPTTNFHIYENAASTVPQLLIQQVNAVGDAALRLLTQDATTFSIGIDITDSKLKINSGATAGANKHLTLTSGGRLGIGTDDVTADMVLAGSASVVNLQFKCFSATPTTHYSRFDFYKSHTDTLDTLVATVDTDVLGAFLFWGVDTAPGWEAAAVILAVQDGNATATSVPAQLEFYTQSETIGNRKQIILNKYGDLLIVNDNNYTKWGLGNDVGIRFSNITTWGGAGAGTQQNMQFWCQGVTASADFQFCDGDVLIGGTGGDNPAAKLDVIGAATIRPTAGSDNGRILLTNAANDAYIALKDAAAATKIIMHTNGVSYFLGGHFGIGATTPAWPLEVVGAVGINPTEGVRAGRVTIHTDGANNAQVEMRCAADNLCIDITAGSTSYIGDGTNRIEFASNGSISFINTAGMQYGSCYGNHIGWSQAGAVQNTWYNVSDADMVSGPLNGVTHDGSGLLTVLKEGMWKINYGCCFQVNRADDHIEIGIEVSSSGSANAAGQSHIQIKFASEEEHASSCAILDLAANDTIEVAIRTTDGATPTISVQAINIVVEQIGGT